MALWTPEEILSDLGLWLDASDSDTITWTELYGEDSITEWADKSGNDRHATQVDSPGTWLFTFPADLNGLDTIQMENGYGALEGAYSATLTEQSVFVVFKYTTATGTNGRIFTQAGTDGDYDSSPYIPVLRDGSNTNIGSYGGSIKAPVAVTDQVYCQFSSVHSGSLISNRVNGGTASTDSHTLSKSITRYRIGLQIDETTSYAIGAIAEVIVLEEAVDTDTREYLEGYLAHKYGLEGDLPSGHTYETEAPTVPTFLAIDFQAPLSETVINLETILLMQHEFVAPVATLAIEFPQNILFNHEAQLPSIYSELQSTLLFDIDFAPHGLNAYIEFGSTIDFVAPCSEMEIEVINHKSVSIDFDAPMSSASSEVQISKLLNINFKATLPKMNINSLWDSAITVSITAPSAYMNTDLIVGKSLDFDMNTQVPVMKIVTDDNAEEKIIKYNRYYRCQ